MTSSSWERRLQAKADLVRDTFFASAPGIDSTDKRFMERRFDRFREHLLIHPGRARLLGTSAAEAPNAERLTRMGEDAGILAVSPAPDYVAGRNYESGVRDYPLFDLIKTYNFRVRELGLIPADEPLQALDLGNGDGSGMEQSARVLGDDIAWWGVADKITLDARKILHEVLREHDFGDVPFEEWLYSSIASSWMGTPEWDAMMSRPTAFVEFLQNINDHELMFRERHRGELDVFDVAGAWSGEFVRPISHQKGLDELVENFMRGSMKIKTLEQVSWNNLYEGDVWGRTELTLFSSSILVRRKWDAVTSSFGLTHMPMVDPNELSNEGKYSTEFLQLLASSIEGERGVIVSNAYRASRDGTSRLWGDYFLSSYVEHSKMVVSKKQDNSFLPGEMINFVLHVNSDSCFVGQSLKDLEWRLLFPEEFFMTFFQMLTAEAMRGYGELTQPEWAQVEREYPNLQRKFLAGGAFPPDFFDFTDDELIQLRVVRPHLENFFWVANWDENAAELEELHPRLFAMLKYVEWEFERQKETLVRGLFERVKAY